MRLISTFALKFQTKTFINKCSVYMAKISDIVKGAAFYKCTMDHLLLVMGRTPFYRTSIELEHHFSNIERTQTCSFVDDRTRTPYFWLRTIEHRTSNLMGPSLDLLNCLTNRLEHQFFVHRTNSNAFIFW